ncbi:MULTISPECIES: hypothetical protein [Caproicibacterium]|uniref:Uncharacterized protein n=1 Tax=Caproicibacterium argilliputei TaxID=3030016 RepID=A0AA97H0R6_9FIRM|nr:hypothetical protein [Caproicibacterium argilliputei]WOC31831.1 hypothetical protein PXC00_11630 [Caproicibacterium argilliputei]
MPRKKAKTLEERIEELDGDLNELNARKAKLDEKIEELTGQKQELLNKIEAQKLAELQAALQRSGLTVEDAIARLAVQPLTTAS